MKKLLLILFTGMLLTSCGKRTETIVGTPGSDGTSCYSETRSSGNFVVCGDSEFEVSDGTNGQDGVDGEDGQDGQDGEFEGYFDLVQLCSNHTPGNKDHIETLLYLDGQYMAFLSNDDWDKQRLTLLEEGRQYRTTDGRNIKFTIIDGNIIYTSHQDKCDNYEPAQ